MNDAVLYSELQNVDNDDHTTTSNAVDSSEPNVVYGNIVQSQEPVLGNANVPSNNDGVLYSELQSKNKAAPSGGLYPQAKKRNTLYPS